MGLETFLDSRPRHSFSVNVVTQGWYAIGSHDVALGLAILENALRHVGSSRFALSTVEYDFWHLSTSKVILILFGWCSLTCNLAMHSYSKVFCRHSSHLDNTIGNLLECGRRNHHWRNSSGGTHVSIPQGVTVEMVSFLTMEYRVGQHSSCKRSVCFSCRTVLWETLCLLLLAWAVFQGEYNGLSKADTISSYLTAMIWNTI
jgi:hypothetical protein